MDKPLLLVVDDGPINLKIVGEMLRQSYRLMVATNAEDALKALQKQRPELIYLI